MEYPTETPNLFYRKHFVDRIRRDVFIIERKHSVITIGSFLYVETSKNFSN